MEKDHCAAQPNVERKDKQPIRNQAAASEAHTVVWGNKKDKITQSVRISEKECCQPGMMELEELEHHRDPPDNNPECMDEDIIQERFVGDGPQGISNEEMLL